MRGQKCGQQGEQRSVKVPVGGRQGDGWSRGGMIGGDRGGGKSRVGRERKNVE